MPIAAEFRGDEQCAQADIPFARERWDAQQVESARGLQREQAGARGCRADDIVVGERPAIVAIGVADRVPHGRAARATARTIRTLRWNGQHHAHQAGFKQRVADEPA